jgi:hypothetical protein
MSALRINAGLLDGRNGFRIDRKALLRRRCMGQTVDVDPVQRVSPVVIGVESGMDAASFPRRSPKEASRHHVYGAAEVSATTMAVRSPGDRIGFWTSHSPRGTLRTGRRGTAEDGRRCLSTYERPINVPPRTRRTVSEQCIICRFGNSAEGFVVGCCFAEFMKIVRPLFTIGCNISERGSGCTPSERERKPREHRMLQKSGKRRMAM